jgi:D-glycero-beta-D-manno-heptose-7-phosphate kinase
MNGDFKLSRERAGAILARCRDRRLLVVGDLILDRYIHGEADRISPEAPVPVVRVTREHAVPGGSSNVALNIRALGGQAVLGGVLGDDDAGAQLRDLLHARGLGLDGVIAHAARTTSVKTRVMAQRQQVVRVDREDTDALPDACIGHLLERIEALLDTVHGVILEDYGKGVIDARLVSPLIEGAKRRGLPVGYDPKDNHELEVRGVTVATPNRREAFLAARMNDSLEPPHPLQDPRLLEAGGRLLQAWEPRHLLLTLGAQGMLLMREGEAPWHVPTCAREVFDVSGAGDTVIAVSLLALTAGASMKEAAALANACAGIVVGKLGTATASPEEVLALLENG